MPLIVEDQGLGLMIESIKREHLVREGVIRSYARKTNTAQINDEPGKTITSQKRALTNEGSSSNRKDHGRNNAPKINIQ